MNSRVFVQPRVLDAKVQVSKANQEDTHFSCMRDSGLETLAGMAPFHIPPYMTVLFIAGTFPQRVVWAQAGMGVGLLWCLQEADCFLFCFRKSNPAS